MIGILLNVVHPQVHKKHTTRESDRLHNHSTIKYKTIIRVDQGLGKLVPYTVLFSIRQVHFSYLISKKGGFLDGKIGIKQLKEDVAQ